MADSIIDAMLPTEVGPLLLCDRLSGSLLVASRYYCGGQISGHSRRFAVQLEWDK